MQIKCRLAIVYTGICRDVDPCDTNSGEIDVPVLEHLRNCEETGNEHEFVIRTCSSGRRSECDTWPTQSSQAERTYRLETLCIGISQARTKRGVEATPRVLPKCPPLGGQRRPVAVQ